MTPRFFVTTALLLALWGQLAGCSIEERPTGKNYRPSGGNQDSGMRDPDAGSDAAMDSATPGVDSAMPTVDAAADSGGGTAMDAGMDAGTDAGIDAGPPPIPAYVVPPLSGGGVSSSTGYRLRHVVGSFGPTHVNTAAGLSSSQNYRLGNALIGSTQ